MLNLLQILNGMKTHKWIEKQTKQIQTHTHTHIHIWNGNFCCWSYWDWMTDDWLTQFLRWQNQQMILSLRTLHETALSKFKLKLKIGEKHFWNEKKNYISMKLNQEYERGKNEPRFWPKDVMSRVSASHLFSSSKTAFWNSWTTGDWLS